MMEVDQPQAPEQMACQVCQVQAQYKCSMCHSVAYCSKEHQKADWKTHKNQCRPYEIKTTPQLGRHLVSTRDIPANSLLIQESPLVFGPKIFEAIRMCLGCYQSVDEEFSVRCPSCFWPICHPECPGIMDPQQHLMECLILSRNPEIAQQNHFRYESIIVLRALLLQKKSASKWSELLAMESHMNLRGPSTEVYKEMETNVVKYLRDNFLVRCGDLELTDCSEETLHKLCGIIDVNGLEVLAGPVEMFAVYPNVCILEHSCMPNTRHSFQEGLKIKLLSAVDIKKGEHLSTMYTHALWGTVARRAHLKATKYFDCSCQRCSDPTELGTNFSTLRCIGVKGDLSEACGNYVLPISPLEESSDWKCQTCPVTLSAEETGDLCERIAVRVDQALQTPDVEGMESILENLEQVLHKNHFHCFAIKHSLIQLYGRQSGFTLWEMTQGQIERKIELCRDVLSVAKVLDGHTGRLVLYIAVALYELSLTLLEVQHRESNEERKKEILNETLDNLKSAENALSNEPQFSAGGRMHSVVLESLKKVESMLQPSERMVLVD